MAKQALRVDFNKAPPQVLKQLFGEAKQSAAILESLAHFQGQAHEQEIFFYLNTDVNGDWVLVADKDGKPGVEVGLQNLRKQLSTMVMTGQIKRFGGERSARYAELTHEGQPDPEDEVDENGEHEIADAE